MNSELNINKMKVADLRKFVSTNGIFKGGLSSMKKSEILDKIYSSDWYKEHGTIEEETEEQPQTETEEQEQQTETDTQTEQTEQTETDTPDIPEDDTEKLQNRLQYLQEQLKKKRDEEENLQKQISYEQEEDRVKQLIQEALKEQREKFVQKLFA